MLDKITPGAHVEFRSEDNKVILTEIVGAWLAQSGIIIQVRILNHFDYLYNGMISVTNLSVHISNLKWDNTWEKLYFEN